MPRLSDEEFNKVVEEMNKTVDALVNHGKLGETIPRKIKLEEAIKIFDKSIQLIQDEIDDVSDLQGAAEPHLVRAWQEKMANAWIPLKAFLKKTKEDFELELKGLEGQISTENG